MRDDVPVVGPLLGCEQQSPGKGIDGPEDAEEADDAHQRFRCHNVGAEIGQREHEHPEADFW